LKKGLAGITKEEMSRVAIAYEPVWAIGTGKVNIQEGVPPILFFVLHMIFLSHVCDLVCVYPHFQVATPEIAQKVHASCRKILKSMYGEEIANETMILYGGSVGPDSVDGLLMQPDIDGALVGGASLSAEKFGRIINFQPVAVPQVRKTNRFISALKKLFRKE
jgi:triosephosphate isomerase